MTDWAVMGLAVAGLWAVEHHVIRGSVEDLGKRIAALHHEVIAWQACHNHTVEELDRRLSGLEEVTALAANEVRIASTELLARLPGLDADSGGRCEQE
jgi:hypothetical protein